MTTYAPEQADREALASLDGKLAVIEDHVVAVHQRFQYGLYLYGEGALGKSYTVTRKLKDLEADFRTFNSRMTPKGLFMALRAAPDAIHLLEDMERLTSDRDAQGVLRSALWAQPDETRRVTWTTAEGTQHFEFRGGVIMLANRPLQNLAELKALASRVIVHKHEVTEAEMVAQVRRIASRGFARGGRTLAPEQCEEVADFLIAACRRANWPVDLRLFDTSCLSYLQWDAGHSKTHWRDLVSIRVRESVSGFKEEQAVQSREERLASDREIVRDILAQAEEPADQVRLWKDRTGKSQATFYNRKREIESREFDES